jgi:hypothetical protein
MYGSVLLLPPHVILLPTSRASYNFPRSVRQDLVILSQDLEQAENVAYKSLENIH